MIISGRNHLPLLQFVLFGATSDLAKRQIVPALAEVVANGDMHHRLVVTGVALDDLGEDGFREICQRAGGSNPDPRWTDLVSDFRYLPGDFNDADLFLALKQVLHENDDRFGEKGSRLFYQATFPSLVNAIIDGIGRNGLNLVDAPGTFARFIAEKPFGVDRASARELERNLDLNFRGSEIFRMDHFVAMDNMLNILAFRFANPIFEPIWNREYIDHIQITSADHLGVGHRGNFYDEAGQVRDVLQNHLMQTLAFILMEPPPNFNGPWIREEKFRLLQALSVQTPEDLHVVRGQYLGGTIDDVDVPAFRSENGVRESSMTESYVAAQFQVANDRWEGVPIFVRTGKRMHHRSGQISIVFKPRIPGLFGDVAPSGAYDDHQMIQIQPHNGIRVTFAAREPGRTWRARPAELVFDYNEFFSSRAPMAYAKALSDAIEGDQSLFITSKEIDRAWSIIAPIQELFASGDLPLCFYPAGSWGPVAADGLLNQSGREWIEPSDW